MRPFKSQTEVLSHSRYVIYDRTAGLPKGRESYGNGDLIVVVGVTSHQGGCDTKQPQGEGDQDFLQTRYMKGMRMQKANHILQALHKLGEKRVPLTRVYRNLYSEDLYLTAYGKIYKKSWGNDTRTR
jgi:hypothetical protein